MGAERHVTPRVIAHLRASIRVVEPKRRSSFDKAQNVLRQACRWARRTDEPGVWLMNDTVGQLAAGTGYTVSAVRAALDTLDAVGLITVARHGGGRGIAARGSTRRLILDPVDNEETARGNPAQFKPQLRGVERPTARGKRPTPRGQPRDTVLHPLGASTRDADPVDDIPVPIPASVKDLLRRPPREPAKSVEEMLWLTDKLGGRT